jgi:hypothetical protein
VAITAVQRAPEEEEWLERCSTGRMVAARMACSTAARIDQERAIPSLETLSSAQYVTPCAAAQSCALARTSERRTEQFLRQRPAANGYTISPEREEINIYEYYVNMVF